MYLFDKRSQEYYYRIWRIVWFRMIEQKTVETFSTAAKPIRLHEPTILNDFVNRSTKTATESLTAKLLNFRVLVRGVREFHLFRIAKPLWLTCIGSYRIHGSSKGNVLFHNLLSLLGRGYEVRVADARIGTMPLRRMCRASCYPFPIFLALPLIEWVDWKHLWYVAVCRKNLSSEGVLYCASHISIFASTESCLTHHASCYSWRPKNPMDVRFQRCRPRLSLMLARRTWPPGPRKRPKLKKPESNLCQWQMVTNHSCFFWVNAVIGFRSEVAQTAYLEPTFNNQPNNGTHSIWWSPKKISRKINVSLCHLKSFRWISF